MLGLAGCGGWHLRSQEASEIASFAALRAKKYEMTIGFHFSRLNKGLGLKLGSSFLSKRTEQ